MNDAKSLCKAQSGMKVQKLKSKLFKSGNNHLLIIVNE